MCTYGANVVLKILAMQQVAALCAVADAEFLLKESDEKRARRKTRAMFIFRFAKP